MILLMNTIDFLQFKIISCSIVVYSLVSYSELPKRRHRRVSLTPRCESSSVQHLAREDVHS